MAKPPAPVLPDTQPRVTIAISFERVGPNAYRVTSHRLSAGRVASSKVECEDAYAVAVGVRDRLFNLGVE